MLASPEVDLVSVVTRVPAHYDLVMRALHAGKAVYCEWPLGATVAEAEDMANLAAKKGLYTAVGLQARSDPTLTYARELIQQGYIGEVLSAEFTYINRATIKRGAGRIFQHDKKNGANILTIGGGHAIDAINFVLGDFADVSARLATRVTEWQNTDTGETVKVNSPDWVSVSGKLQSTAEVQFLVAAMPAMSEGRRSFDIYGREGMLSVRGGAGRRGKEPEHLSRAQPAVRLARERAADGHADARALHPDPRHRAGRAAAQRGPGLYPPGSGHARRQAVQPELRRRGPCPQAGRSPGKILRDRQIGFLVGPQAVGLNHPSAARSRESGKPGLSSLAIPGQDWIRFAGMSGLWGMEPIETPKTLAQTIRARGRPAVPRP